MAKKYCEKCLTPTEMNNLECGKCGGSSFVHSLPTEDYCDCGIPDLKGNICLKCSKEVNPTRLAKLAPATSTVNTSSASGVKVSASKNSGSLANLSTSPTGKSIDDLIRAQNRTTHAVRAFVRFLFIQLSSATLAAIIWSFSASMANSCATDGTNCSSSTVLQFISGLIVLVGIGWSSSAGWSELEKSNID